MTNFKHLQTMTVDELAGWLDEYGQFDCSPWSEWFSQTYCAKCEPIKCKYANTEDSLYNGREIDCSYCELEGHCKFFPDLDDTPDNLETIKMWLNKEAK